MNILDNISELWEAVLTELKGMVSDVILTTWIMPLQPVAIEKDKLILKTATVFRKSIVTERFSGNIERALENVLGFPVKIDIEIEAAAGDSSSIDADGTYASPEFIKNFEPTFDNFIVGSTNQFAYVAAVAVAKNPGSVHNPLFIYGESGLGKTHLLRAIKDEISISKPFLNILYTNGENFMNEMITHISEKNMSEFHKKYRSADVLLVDDIQFIAAKPAVQEEFFYTFDSLINEGKQIVLTSDRPPKDIQSLEERLRSRFIQGLLADIQPPLLETRIAIIRRKAQILDMKIPDDVTEYMAEKLKNNVRQIEGVVKKMYAIYSINGNAPAIGIANDVIKDVIYYAQPTEVTVNNIIERVAKSFGVSPEDIRSEKKNAEISNARQIAIYVMRDVTNLTYEEIGKALGGKKHSTIIYSFKSAEEKMGENPSLKASVYDIIKDVKDEKDN